MVGDGSPSGSDVDVNKWKEQKFPRGSRARATFEHLCLLGCDPRGLLSFLTVTVFTSQTQKTVFDTYGVSQSALVKLPKRLEEVALDLDAVKQLLGHYLQAFFLENSNLSDEVRSGCRHQASLYQRIPELLRVLAADLRAAHTRLFKHVGPKRIDLFRKMVLDLLTYVETCTKSPHYQQVADLLDHLYSTDQKFLANIPKPISRPTRPGMRKKKSVPKLLTSADALKALYYRAEKYGFRKGRQSKSALPPSP
jgi:hypothetical protein